MRKLLKPALYAAATASLVFAIGVSAALPLSSIPKISALFETSLASKISSSATSMTLVSGTDKSGNSLSGVYGFIIDEGTASEEFVIGTTSGTAVTGMLRGVSVTDATTEVTALKKEHRRGSSVKITTFPFLGIVYRILQGTEGYPNVLSYVSHPTFTTNTQIVDKKYVDDTAFAGAPDSSTTIKGVAEEATEAEINAGTAAGGTSARLFVNPSTLLTSNYGTNLPTAGQKAALPGSSGAPGATNLYVTQDDVEDDGYDQTQTTRDGTTPVGEADATTKANKLAQSFIAGKTSQTGVYLHKLADTGTFTGTVTVALQADSAGTPSGSNLASVTISNATWLATAAGLFQATYSSPYTATIGTTYWLVISTSTADNSNHPNLGTNTAGGYSSGSVKKNNTTDGWAAIATIDLTFKTTTTYNSKVLRLDSSGGLPAISGSSLTGVSATKTGNSTFIAGESLTAGNVVVLKSDLEQGFADAVTNMGDVSGNTQVSVSVTPQSTVTLTNVKMFISKNNSPVDNLTIEVQGNSAGSPDNTAITNGTSNTVASSSMAGWTGSWPNFASTATFTFGTPPSLTGGTTYWFVLKRSGGNDGTNYLVLNANSVGSGTIGKNVSKKYNGSAWSSLTSMPSFKVTLATGVLSSRLYKATSANGALTDVYGIIQATTAADATGTVVETGVDANQASLVPGDVYYLSTAGAIANAVGTYGRVIGTAVSATSIELQIRKATPTSSATFYANSGQTNQWFVPCGFRPHKLTLWLSRTSADAVSSSSWGAWADGLQQYGGSSYGGATGNIVNGTNGIGKIASAAAYTNNLLVAFSQTTESGVYVNYVGTGASFSPVSMFVCE